MRRIPQRRRSDPPALVGIDGRRAVVIVLALGIHQPPKPARLVDLPHRVAIVVIRARLGHHVRQASLLHGLYELLGVLDRAVRGRHARHHVLAVVEGVQAVLGVAGGVGRHEDRFDLRVLHQDLQRFVRLRAPAGLHQVGAALGDQVAHGDHLDVRMVLKAEGRAHATDPVAHNAQANLAIRDGLRFGRLGRLDLRGEIHGQHGPQGTHPELFQERTPIDGEHELALLLG